MGLNRVFVYGTLKKGEPNHRLLTDINNGQAVFVGKGTTCQAWPLVIATKYNVPFLLFVPGKGHHVTGEIYDVDDSMLSVLDELEAYPILYERIQYDVLLSDNNENDAPATTKCWIYLLKKYKPFMLELPYLNDYSSYGKHGLEYVLSEDVNDPEKL